MRLYLWWWCDTLDSLVTLAEWPSGTRMKFERKKEPKRKNPSPQQTICGIALYVCSRPGPGEGTFRLGSAAAFPAHPQTGRAGRMLPIPSTSPMEISRFFLPESDNFLLFSLFFRPAPFLIRVLSGGSTQPKEKELAHTSRRKKKRAKDENFHNLLFSSVFH